MGATAMNSRKAKAQLIEELKTLRKQLTKAEKAEAEHKPSSRIPSHLKMNKGSLMRKIECLMAAFIGQILRGSLLFYQTEVKSLSELRGI
jgi:uncharacterized membrane protein YdbT with pleckstrin-like domain